MFAKNISKNSFFEGKFLKFEKIKYVDEKGAEREWESVGRVDSPEIVNIITWLQPSNRLLFIKQFRPPVGKEIIEFPAGLIDLKESPKEAAIRELKEETGYVGKVVDTPVFTWISPGMSSENIYQIVVEVDETAPENQFPEQDLDEEENISVYKVGVDKLNDFFEEQSNNGVQISAMMMCYLMGLTT